MKLLTSSPISPHQMVAFEVSLDSNLCYAYRVVLGLIFIVIIYQQTLALCLSTRITYGLRVSSSGRIVLSVEFATNKGLIRHVLSFPDPTPWCVFLETEFRSF
jgi:hypothetical protein